MKLCNWHYQNCVLIFTEYYVPLIADYCVLWVAGNTPVAKIKFMT